MPRRWLAPDFFTDEKMKKATVPERLLGAAIIANQDDDGRLRGDPAYLRSIAFLYDDYSLHEVAEMRDHLAKINPNIIIYQNDGDEYIQLKRYKRYQRPRYYHPSKFPEPPGWPFEEDSNQTVTTKQPKSNHLVTQDLDLDKGKDLDLDKGKGRKPRPQPSLTDLSTDGNKITNNLVESFKMEWGRVPAESPGTIIPREPSAKERAQLRDLGKEISSAGCPLSYIREAFREVAGQDVESKMCVRYVRKVLLAWLEDARAPP